MSKEYIEREALIAEIEENINTYWNEGSGGYYLAEDALNYSIKTAPIADVEEVQHGYWEEWWDDNYLSYCHKCSKCGGYPLTKEETMHDEVLSAYCPYCGTKMDGGKAE